VLATDISPAILGYAARVAAEAGVANVETLEADGEDLAGIPDGAFDAAISRVGLIYFPDQQRALAEICRVLRPGGRLSSVVYSTPDKNGFFSIPVGIIRRIAGLPAPAPGMPGPFSLGAEGVAEATYAKAGLVDITVTTVSSPVRMADARECVRFEQESFGALHQMLSGVDEEARKAAWLEIEEALRQFDGPAGFVGPCEMLVVSGTRAS
jgi:SAM-dependent methyltransferase